MPSSLYALAACSLLASASGHVVLLNAQGLPNSSASVGFGVDPAIARNCITINPCQQDTTIIRDAEITANIVNQCGRTELTGNIDVGENTENALAANQVTQVQAGSEITLTMHQVNADGAGPFFCDIDQTGNTGLNLQNLTVTNNVEGTNGLSQAKTKESNITIQMPNDLACIGASTGNVCTVRCRNNAVAGPFGGCFAVQQVDTQAKANTPGNIQTGDNLEPILNQVQRNQADFKASVDANERASTDEAQQNLAGVNAILSNTVVSALFPQETPSVDLGGNAAQQNQAANNQNGGQRNQNGNGGNRGQGNNQNGGNQGNNQNGRGRGNNQNGRGQGNNRNGANNGANQANNQNGGGKGNNQNGGGQGNNRNGGVQGNNQNGGGQLAREPTKTVKLQAKLVKSTVRLVAEGGSRAVKPVPKMDVREETKGETKGEIKVAVAVRATAKTASGVEVRGLRAIGSTAKVQVKAKVARLVAKALRIMESKLRADKEEPMETRWRGG
ncbi:hypothetical protein DCS_04633 [Drechmeria coniospora]|uniref:GEgh 16 protein n=1 Tax=Drechmeria coniospora TaxID=98403 RepID=A0A151GKQ8_DRECN|nr:hypothetical protein DCS_04633 [Drechmeria coniospora]KYK57621.1 hypothetical protein DCS_04633 [Drechmeria coniospora]